MLTHTLLYASACLIRVAAGGVTIVPGGEPKPYEGPAPVESDDELFRLSVINEFADNNATILMTSHDPADASLSKAPFALSSEDGIRPSSDSFIRGAIEAWGGHQHLVIRPEEVWFTILVQMNFYMNSHAEEIRDLFVDHEGKEEIEIETCCAWTDVLILFKDEIQNRVKTDWLLDWIMPDFTTTTESDTMTANILMMGLMQHYFSFTGGIICGLPSVTLLGEKEDWEALLAKLERIPEFGPEAAAYSDRLKPILSRFVSSFEDPDGEDTRAFWNQIVTAEPSAVCGGPPYFISGWVVGFYFWDAQGAPYGQGQEDASDDDDDGGLSLDGIRYPTVDLDSLPISYARAPLTMLDFGGMERFPAYVLAGAIGKKVTPGAPEGYADALDRRGDSLPSGDGNDDENLHSSLQPLSAWMVYGPLDRNATERNWQEETEEYQQLASAIGSNYDQMQCAGNISSSV